jgi:predicted nuclease of restriction endonuclease-like RecB superfamily
MLTADLVRARRRGGRLNLTALSGRLRLRALELAERYLQLARISVGKSREELDELCRAVPAPGNERKVAQGLLKLVLDRCEFETEAEIDPRALRQAVFVSAAAQRREAERAEDFSRDAVLAAAAEAQGLSPERLEALLYADLRAAQRLLSFAATSAEKLVADYELAGEQAVLLRALRVTASIEVGSPLALRRLFAKLKFLRLLFRLEADGPGRYQLEIDGPASLYRASTRYGLQLALALPALRACDRFELRAEVLWGKDRSPLEFQLEGGQASARSASKARREKSAGATARQQDPRRVELCDEAATLLERFERRDSSWSAVPCTEVLQLPGVGLCVPDLRFIRGEGGPEVYLEILGFWSREAVWKRVELVEQGLRQRVLFAVSERLRVSEKALDANLPAALLVFKGVIQAKAVEQKLDALVARSR